MTTEIPNSLVGMCVVDSTGLVLPVIGFIKRTDCFSLVERIAPGIFRLTLNGIQLENADPTAVTSKTTRNCLVMASLINVVGSGNNVGMIAASRGITNFTLLVFVTTPANVLADAIFQIALYQFPQSGNDS